MMPMGSPDMQAGGDQPAPDKNVIKQQLMMMLQEAERLASKQGIDFKAIVHEYIMGGASKAPMPPMGGPMPQGSPEGGPPMPPM